MYYIKVRILRRYKIEKPFQIIGTAYIRTLKCYYSAGAEATRSFATSTAALI